MISNDRDLSRYKAILRELKISHLQLGEYTGHTRETVTIWLNGKQPPLKLAKHLSQEIEELILKKQTTLPLSQSHLSHNNKDKSPSKKVT